MRGATRPVHRVLPMLEPYAFRNRQNMLRCAMSHSSTRHAGNGPHQCSNTASASSFVVLGMRAAAVATGIGYYVMTRDDTRSTPSTTTSDAQSRGLEYFRKKTLHLRDTTSAGSELEFVRTTLSHYLSAEKNFVVTSTGPLIKQPVELGDSGGKMLLPEQTCGWVVEQVLPDPSNPLAEPHRRVVLVVAYAHLGVAYSESVILGMVQALEKLDQWGMLGPQTFATAYLGT